MPPVDSQPHRRTRFGGTGAGGGAGVSFFYYQEKPLEDPLNRVLKRIFDVAVALLVLLGVLPLLSLCVAFMQRLQAPEPLLFLRARGAQRGSEFTMFKYRSFIFASPARRRSVSRRVGQMCGFTLSIVS